MSPETLPVFMRPMMPSRLSYPGFTCGGRRVQQSSWSILKCQGFLGKEQSSHQKWLTERRGSTRYEIKSGYTEGRGSILGLNILEIMLLSEVRPSEIWVTTMTPGNPKWNENSSF